MFRHPALRLAAITTFAVGLALAAHGCGDDEKNPTAPPGGGADVTISIVANAGANSYSPSPDTVTVGQTVAWKNNDTVPHTATEASVAWNTGSIAPGATSAAITMGTAGSFDYVCTIHPSMTGKLVVQP